MLPVMGVTGCLLFAFEGGFEAVATSVAKLFPPIVFSPLHVA